jgi:hypothetical protein
VGATAMIRRMAAGLLGALHAINGLFMHLASKMRNYCARWMMQRMQRR